MQAVSDAVECNNLNNFAFQASSSRKRASPPRRLPNHGSGEDAIPIRLGNVNIFHGTHQNVLGLFRQ
ncbi:MAG: hypothetical protein LW834_01970 [Cyanobium sp. 49614_E6]|nr:hypothetical protein [Cyanobium sp. 49614_E6]